jgi:predicted Zn-dependent protease
MYDAARSQSPFPTRFLIALVVAGISLIGYFTSRQQNPVTGETQHVSISPQQEIALGLQAAPELEQEYGGPSGNAGGQALVEKVGNRIVAGTAAKDSPYRFQFHLLKDRETINAFALPGGQVFITEALARKLKTEGELAGVLGHEIGHVVGRHGAEQLAKQRLLQGLGGAGVIATSDPNDPNRAARNQAVAAAVMQLINLRYGRDDELEADKLGVRLMSESGFDPRSMLKVMQVLEETSSGSSRKPDFLSTHPNPGRRSERIKEAIKQQFPNGVPNNLQP